MNENMYVDMWVRKINQSKDKSKIIKTLLREVDLLEKTGEEKELLLEQLYEQLLLPPRLSNGHFLLNEQTDNKYYLDLIKHAILMLKKNSKSQG